ncbi:MAG: hypothetical protein AAGF95_30865 [Chloroflexota bacterium]
MTHLAFLYLLGQLDAIDPSIVGQRDNPLHDQMGIQSVVQFVSLSQDD